VNEGRIGARKWAHFNGAEHTNENRARGRGVSRIGLVLYWAAMIAAAVTGGIALLRAALGQSDVQSLIAGLMCAFGAILIGYGCRRAFSRRSDAAR
jgi:hypothetical protein